MINVGQLDQQITLQEFTSSQNDYGETIKTYSDIETVWAKVIARKGDESFEAARTQSSRQIKICIHYRNDITTSHRIIWMNENYNIVEVDRSLRMQGELWLMCKTAIAS